MRVIRLVGWGKTHRLTTLSSAAAEQLISLFLQYTNITYWFILFMWNYSLSCIYAFISPYFAAVFAKDRTYKS